MNRSLTNVLFGGIAAPQQSAKKIEGEVTQTNVEETVDALANAESVIIVRPSSAVSPAFSALTYPDCRVRHGRRKSAIRPR
jgi:NAD/NADP transhydrogenase beta subunit